MGCLSLILLWVLTLSAFSFSCRNEVIADCPLCLSWSRRGTDKWVFYYGGVSVCNDGRRCIFAVPGSGVTMVIMFVY